MANTPGVNCHEAKFRVSKDGIGPRPRTRSWPLRPRSRRDSGCHCAHKLKNRKPFANATAGLRLRWVRECGGVGPRLGGRPFVAAGWRATATVRFDLALISYVHSLEIIRADSWPLSAHLQPVPLPRTARGSSSALNTTTGLELFPTRQPSAGHGFSLGDGHVASADRQFRFGECRGPGRVSRSESHGWHWAAARWPKCNSVGEAKDGQSPARVKAHCNVDPAHEGKLPPMPPGRKQSLKGSRCCPAHTPPRPRNVGAELVTPTRLQRFAARNAARK